MLIPLQTTVRGVRLVVAPPDARYRRCHTFIHPHPDETVVGRAVRVQIPARFQDGTMMCAAYTQWEIEGRRVDPALYFLTPVLRDKSDEWCRGTGRWELLESAIPAGDAELLALKAEIAALDAAWLASRTEEISAEDRRREWQSRAAVHDESGRDPSLGRAELECLECGAVFTSPGSVDPGGMACRRCG